MGGAARDLSAKFNRKLISRKTARGQFLLKYKTEDA